MGGLVTGRRIATGGAACRALFLLLMGMASAGVTVPLADAAPTFPGANGKIAFERGNETAEHDIYTVDPDGSNELNLTHNGSNNRQIAWAPDGSRIAFFSDGDGSDNYYDVHVAKADGSGAVRVANTGGANAPVWSPDGRWIAFADGFLYVVRPDGTGLRAVTWMRVSYPAWSPDGSKIAFGSNDGYRTDIWVVNPDGSGLERLTDDLDRTNGAVSWSPDGTQVAYASGREFGCDYAGCVRMYLMNADGTNRRKLTDRQAYYASWAPDGSRIAFQVWGEGPPKVYTVKPDGTGETRLTDPPGLPNSPDGDYGPEWSPDSAKLVFNRSSRDGPRHQVWTINHDGTGERYVAPGWDAQWQPLPTGRAAKRLCQDQRRRIGNAAFRARYGPAKSASEAMRNCVARGGQ
jgi:Tol biopolymer transport system component